jgi:hypothetical protein
MTSSRRAITTSLAAILAVGSILLLGPSAAHAQRNAQDLESARQLYNQGIELREKGDMKGALEKFRAAHALGNTPLTGIELCKAHSALHQPVEAREVCLGVARIPPTSQETPRSQEARNEAGRIAEGEKSKIGAIRLKITGVPQGYEPTVMVDGANVPTAALAEPRAVNPGIHTVSARVGSGVETKASLETKEGETRDVELIVAPPPPGEKPVPVVGGGGGQQGGPPPPPPEKKNTLATVMFAIGGVSAVIGTIGGISAMSGESDLADKCRNKVCGQEFHDDLDSAKTWGNVSTAFFIIAGVAVGVGLVSVVANSSSKSGSSTPTTRTVKRTAPTLSWGGTGVYGSF